MAVVSSCREMLGQVLSRAKPSFCVAETCASGSPAHPLARSVPFRSFLSPRLGTHLFAPPVDLYGRARHTNPVHH